MEKQPLVSIVLPVYGRAHLLPRTIESILSQTHKNLEILLVDDGTPVPLKPVSDSFNDSRIVYIRHHKNMGVAEARNTALKAARGEFIAFLDGDDEYLSEKIEKQLNLLLANESGGKTVLVYCGILVEKQGRYAIGSPKACKWNVLLQQILVRKEIIDICGFFDTRFSHGCDIDYIYRLSRICRFAAIREPLVIFHSIPGSHSKNSAPLNKCTEFFVKKHSKTLLPAERSKWLYFIGNRYIHMRWIPEAQRSFFRAFIAYPLNQRALRKIIRLAPLVVFHSLKGYHHDRT